MLDQKKLKNLKDYFVAKSEVSMAFLFGSVARGREITESDVDVAVYYTPPTQECEWEETKEYLNEGALWLDVERIIGRNTDLVVLNRAPAGLAFEILRTSIPIVCKDRNLYTRFFLLVSDMAESFRQTANEWWAIQNGLLR